MIDHLWENIKQLPLTSQSVIYIAVISITGVLGINNNWIKSTILKKANSSIFKISEGQLKNHPIFSKKLFYKELTHKINLDSKEKTEIFRSYIDSKINIDISILEQLVIDEPTWTKKSRNEVLELIFSKIDLMVFTSEKDTKSNIAYIYGHKKATVLFEFVFNSTNGINKSRGKRVDTLKKRLEVIILDSSIYNSNQKMVQAFMNEVQFCLEIAIDDTLTKFNDFNGQINKIING